MYGKCNVCPVAIFYELHRISWILNTKRTMMSSAQKHACPMSSRQLKDYVYEGIISNAGHYTTACVSLEGTIIFDSKTMVHLIPCKINSIYPIKILNALRLVSCSVPPLPSRLQMVCGSLS